MNLAIQGLSLEQLGALYSLQLSAEEGVFVAPYKPLARMWKWSPNKVKRFIQHLVERGLITPLERDGLGRRRYRLEGAPKPPGGTPNGTETAPPPPPQVHLESDACRDHVVEGGTETAPQTAPPTGNRPENGLGGTPKPSGGTPNGTETAPPPPPQVHLESDACRDHVVEGGTETAPQTAPPGKSSGGPRRHGTQNGTPSGPASRYPPVAYKEASSGGGTQNGTPPLLLLLQREKYFSERKKKEKKALDRLITELGFEAAADVAKVWVLFIETRSAVAQAMEAASFEVDTSEDLSLTVWRGRKIHGQIQDYGRQHVFDAVRNIWFSRWHCDPLEPRLNPEAVFNTKQMDLLVEEKKTQPGWIKSQKQLQPKQTRFDFPKEKTRTLHCLTDQIPLNFFGDGEEAEVRREELCRRICDLERLGELDEINRALAVLQEQTLDELSEIYQVDEEDWGQEDLLEVFRLPRLAINTLDEGAYQRDLTRYRGPGAGR